MCFIYNEYQKLNSNAYNCGDLGKCCEQGARRKLFDTMDVFWQDPAARSLEAARSLYRKKGYEAQDFFKGDIYYHNFCYLKFVLEQIEQAANKIVELLEDNILEGFFGAKDKHRKWEGCIFGQQPTGGYKTFKWTQWIWIDRTYYLEYENIVKRRIIDKSSDDVSFTRRASI